MANIVVFFARMDAFIPWRGVGCGKNGGGDILVLAACKSWQWTARREQEGRRGGCSDEALAMLSCGGRAADDTTRGVGAEGAKTGELEADDSTMGGGRQREASGRRTTLQHNKRVGAHEVVGGGGDDSGGDIGGGSWLSEVGGAPPSMPGTAALASSPASGGVDDAKDVPMAVGSNDGNGRAVTNQAGRQATTRRLLPRQQQLPQ